MRRLAIRSRRGAYVALVVLTLIWGFNWVALKLAMQHADPVVFNTQRILVAISVLVALMVWQRKSLAPQSWIAIIVTGFFQTTINFASTTMAVATGGAGRASVLVFTMSTVSCPEIRCACCTRGRLATRGTSSASIRGLRSEFSLTSASTGRPIRASCKRCSEQRVS